LIEAFDLATSGVLILTRAYINLSERESEEMLTDGDIKNKSFDFGPTYDTPGGVWVLSVEVFQQIKGWDERFIGWGYEDKALNKAYEKICEKKVYRANTAVLSFANKNRNYTVPSLYNNKQRYEQ
jgi:predicted glycosyltransferase involved in capsule biosynthesis